MDSKNPSGAKGRAEVYDWIQCIIFALVFCVLLFVFAVRMVNVVGHSMVPTLEQSDKVVISNYAGTEVKLDGEEYKIVRQNDILAVVE